jgi:hypothetical protein
MGAPRSLSSRLFTPLTALDWIARSGPVAARACRLYRELETRGHAPIRSDTRVEPGYFDTLLALGEALHTVRRSGARVTDVRRGLVGLPARRDGRPVWLCWRVGEGRLAYWREPGGKLRHPVADDGRWEDPPAVLS